MHESGHVIVIKLTGIQHSPVVTEFIKNKLIVRGLQQFLKVNILLKKISSFHITGESNFVEIENINLVCVLKEEILSTKTVKDIFVH